MTANSSLENMSGYSTSKNKVVTEVNLISFIVLILFTSISNILTAIVIMKNKKLHVPYQWHTLNLIIVNILVSITLIPLRLVNVVDKELWYTSRTFCEMYLRLSVVYSLVSIFTLGAITIECYMALKHQTKYRHCMSTRNVLFLTILIWLMALAISFLSSLAPTSRAASVHCTFRDVHGKGFLACYVCLGVLIPLLSIFCINCKAVKSSLKYFRSVDITGKIPYLDDLTTPISIHEFASWSRVIFKLLLMFIVFWVPRCVVLLYKDETKQNSKIFQVVDDLTEVYTYCFFAGVPLLLGYCSEEFSDTFQRIMCPYQGYKQHVQYKRKYGRSPNKVWPFDWDEPRVP